MDFKGRYIPRTAASEAYDSQYMKRAERNINKLNAVHVIWTVTSTMKGELDDEMESKGLMKGEYKRWSRHWEEEYGVYCRTIGEVLIKENLPGFAEAYEDLDAFVRNLANLETRTRVCWGRLHMSAYALASLAGVISEDVGKGIDHRLYFCRRLKENMGALRRATAKWLGALMAAKAIPIRELPVDLEDFVKKILDHIYGRDGKRTDGDSV